MPTLPTRKANYLIMVHLETGDPDVTRLLPLAPDMSFSEVHDAIQIAFNWADMHSYAFYVRLASHMGEMMDDLPSTSYQGHGLPNMIITRLVPLGDPEENHVYDDQITLEQVYEDLAYRGKAAITYECDHGDSWGHTLSLIGRTSPDFLGQMHAPEGTRVLCIGGEGNHFAEDSGGYCGLDKLKECFRKGKRGDLEDRRGWYEEDCANGGKEKKFDPYAWSIFVVNDGLMERFPPGVIEKEMAAIKAIKNEK